MNITFQVKNKKLKELEVIINILRKELKDFEVYYEDWDYYTLIWNNKEE